VHKLSQCRDRAVQRLGSKARVHTFSRCLKNRLTGDKKSMVSDSKHNRPKCDTQRNVVLNVACLTVMLSVIMLNVVMLTVIATSFQL